MRILCLFVFTCIYFVGNTQQSIDGTINFQTDPAKKYSIYVPSSYDENQANALMVGLHPLNTNRWDAISWRDTLIVFAESNNLLLAVPDGGEDGAIDDPIDTAFTSLLIDSMSVWYNVNEEEKFLMGFSWGGKTVYSYGLRRTDEFAGFIPIGAAISGGAEIQALTPNATNENWYIVHGSNDSPNNRFTPAVEQLTEAGACLETNLLAGVGHNIDFPNRNEILSEAFNFVKENMCISSTLNTEDINNFSSIPNPSNSSFQIENLTANAEIKCIDLNGRSIDFIRNENQINVDQNFSGLLFIYVNDQGKSHSIKQVILSR